MPTDSIERLEGLLDQVDRRLRIAIYNALIAARDAPGTIVELTALIEQGRISEAIDEAARIGAIRISQEYAAVYTLSAQDTMAHIETQLGVVIGFDQVNFRAVNQIQNSRLHLIQQFTQEQRNATRIALTDGITRGVNPREQARLFRSSIGLTGSQQQAVINYRRLLQNVSEGDTQALSRDLRDRRFDRTVARAADTRTPLSNDQVNRMVTRYRDRYLIYRSETIARTEALRSVHQGAYEAYEQAIEEGYIDQETIERTWRTANDERVRDSHNAANNQTRGFREPFIVGGSVMQFPGDSSAPAREVINCRCIAVTRYSASR